MNSTRTLSPHNPRGNSVEYLITKGLGYCCEYAFFLVCQEVPSELIAARLGCEVNTIRRHRLWLRNGKITCKKLESCMLPKLERKFPCFTTE